MSSIQVARYIISFSWLYHGLFPKLIEIAPLEQLMTSSAELSNETNYLIIKTVGVGEVLFGILVFIFYKSRLIISLNIVALIVLLTLVAVLQPQLLIEAFNPVTTNIPLIGLSFILLNNIKQNSIV